MSEKTIISGVLMDEHSVISFVEICQKCNISEEALLELIEHGLCDDLDMPIQDTQFDEKTLSRIQSACRLQQDLGINVPGVVLVLELLDELEELRNKLDVFQHHVGEE